MASDPQNLPPWVQEQLQRYYQLQQSLQGVVGQKQQLEMEQKETEKALEELKKTEEGVTVYKSAGSILIKSTKENLLSELEEKKELNNTRTTVLGKQEQRLRDNLKELENKLNEMMKGGGQSSGAQSGPSAGMGVGGSTDQNIGQPSS